MRAKYLLTTISVLSLGIAGNVLADDVYVDLSVLDNLQDSSSPVVHQGPLFPIVSASDSQKPSPVKQVRKAKKTSAKSSKAKLVIPAKKSVKVEVQEDTKQQDKIVEKAKIEQPVVNTGPFKVAPVEPKVDSVQAAPSIPVKSVNLPVEEKTSSVEEKTNAAETAMPQTQEPTVVSNTEAKEQQSTPLPVVPSESSKQDTDISSSLQKELNDMSKPQISQSVLNKEEKPSLLIENNPSPAVKEKVMPTVSEIFFAAESDELTDANKAEIDNIINAFENAKENKIAIYSFNLDDGNDSFRKKRISLNRAIAVRSYLLGKGYKNFSIKVVNLDEANGKENSVRIEELK